MARIVIGACLLAVASAAEWAVIMAGSNTYGNYRHQADACHAYQIAKKMGIPASNIILMAFDDIANNKENPFKGKMFNKPNGTDVYAGCEISYKGNSVNAENFLKVLKGDASAPGPVLKSTAEDRVFVYFADHGGPGILGVPNPGAGRPYIHAADVNAALVDMNKKGMYKELLFYVEACESGSIFNKLLTAPKVKAVTAANPTESSWGFYCPPLDKVQGKKIGSCLGDEFSIRWMEDADVASKSETIKQQVATVTKETKKSHVQQYGDTSFDSEPIGNFESALRQSVRGPQHGAAVNSRDIELHLAFYAVKRAESSQAKKAAEQKLESLLEQRREEDTKYLHVAMAAVGKEKAQSMLEGPIEHITKVDCHKAALSAAMSHCGAFTDYSMRYSRLFVNLCEDGISEKVVVAAVEHGCSGSVHQHVIDDRVVV